MLTAMYLYLPSHCKYLSILTITHRKHDLCAYFLSYNAMYVTLDGADVTYLHIGRENIVRYLSGNTEHTLSVL